jgi:CheY-like chemotaxis protein
VSASILVADDEPNIVLSLEFLLKQAGYRVRTVSAAKLRSPRSLGSRRISYCSMS